MDSWHADYSKSCKKTELSGAGCIGVLLPSFNILPLPKQKTSSVHQYKVCCFPCRPLTREPAEHRHDDALTAILQAAVALRRLHAHPALKRVLGPPTTVSKHCKRMPRVCEQEAEDSEQGTALYNVAMQKRLMLERQIIRFRVREAAAAEAAAASFTLEVPAGQAHHAAVHELQEAPAAQLGRTADEARAASSLASGEAKSAMTYRQIDCCSPHRTRAGSGTAKSDAYVMLSSSAGVAMAAVL